MAGIAANDLALHADVDAHIIADVADVIRDAADSAVTISFNTIIDIIIYISSNVTTCISTRTARS